MEQNRLNLVTVVNSSLRFSFIFCCRFMFWDHRHADRRQCAENSATANIAKDLHIDFVWTENCPHVIHNLVRCKSPKMSLPIQYTVLSSQWMSSSTERILRGFSHGPANFLSLWQQFQPAGPTRAVEFIFPPTRPCLMLIKKNLFVTVLLMTLNLCEKLVNQLPLLNIKQQEHPMIITERQLITEMFLFCKKFISASWWLFGFLWLNYDTVKAVAYQWQW